MVESVVHQESSRIVSMTKWEHFILLFMKNHIFPYLNREVTDRVFPMYWYMVYNYSVFTSIIPGVLEYYVALPEHDDGQTDCWITCFWGDKAHSTYDDPITGWKTPIAGNKDSFTIRPLQK